MEQTNRRTFSWLIAIVLILLLVFGWHLVLPVLGLTMVVTAVTWGVVVATITMLSIVIILFFVFSSVGILVLGIFGFLWVIVAIILFPVIFPIVIPLLIIFLFIGFFLWKQ